MASFLVDLRRVSHALWSLWHVLGNAWRFVACSEDTFTLREYRRRFLHRFWEPTETILTHGELDIRHLRRCAVAWHPVPYLG